LSQKNREFPNSKSSFKLVPPSEILLMISNARRNSRAQLSIRAQHGFHSHLEAFSHLISFHVFSVPGHDAAGGKVNMAPVHQAAADGDIETLRRLIEVEGVGPNTLDKDGRPPLYSASCLGHLDIACYLLDAGAKINLSEKYGSTPLMAACTQGGLKMVRLLLSRGADPSLRDRYGWTALQGVCSWLQEDSAEIVRLLIKTGKAQVNARSNLGETALQHACTWGRVDIARILLMEGCADPLARDQDGRTAMAIAQEAGKHRCVELLEVGRLAERLLSGDGDSS
jgi:ankyrin repeat protein